MEKRKLRILVACLNWGIGHASRSIPVIKLLEDRGHELTIGSDGRALNFLRKELPGRDFVRIKDVKVRYKTGKLAMFFSLLNSGLKLKKIRRKEHLFLHRMNVEEPFDVVISDNRYGLFSPNIYSVLITHQLKPRMPFGRKFAEKIVEFWTGYFHEVWIPDDKNIKLSGKLSKGKHYNQKHVGVLSRVESKNKKAKSIDYLFVLSGPEPLRTQFEQQILAQAEQLGGTKIVLVRGTNSPRKKVEKPSSNTEILDLVGSEELQSLMLSAENIVCRSGYSTIMDLVKLGLEAYLVPTPNQWEQEYLAKYLKQKKYFNSCAQGDFDVHKIHCYPSVEFTPNEALLEAVEAIEAKLLKA